MTTLTTPAHVEQRLINLSRELDSASEALDAAEMSYARAKSAWEINGSKTRMAIKSRALDAGRKVTVQDVDDEATVRCQDELTALNTSEAIVKSARNNIMRIRLQIDIARSVGTSVRAAMELS